MNVGHIVPPGYLSALREELTALKTGLAERHRRDRASYTEAKGGLVRRVLQDWRGSRPS